MTTVDEARAALHEAVHNTVVQARRCKGCYYTRAIDALIAAVRAEGLDVERLAAAMEAEGLESHWEESDPYPDGSIEVSFNWDSAAEAIAAECARLAEAER